MITVDELRGYIRLVLDNFQLLASNSATGLTAWEKGRFSAYEDILDYLEGDYDDEI